MELFVNHTSGGAWPTGVNARVFADGTLTLGDGESQLRRRVSTNDPEFRRLLFALETEAFSDELHAAAMPTDEWRSSGTWIRVERGETIALIKPPVGTPHIRAVLGAVNSLFERQFGRRYRTVPLD